MTMPGIPNVVRWNDNQICCYCGAKNYSDTWSSWNWVEVKTVAIAELTSSGWGLAEGWKETWVGMRFECVRSLDVAVCGDCRTSFERQDCEQDRKIGIGCLCIFVVLALIAGFAIMTSKEWGLFPLYCSAVPLIMGLLACFGNKGDSSKIGLAIAARERKYGCCNDVANILTDAGVLGKTFLVPPGLLLHFCEIEKATGGWSAIGLWKHEGTFTRQHWGFSTEEAYFEASAKTSGFNLLAIGAKLNEVRRPPLAPIKKSP